MTYLMVDISGRSPVYDIPLCEALHRVMSPEHRKVSATHFYGEAYREAYRTTFADIEKIEFLK